MLFFSFTNMFSATTISKCACLRLFIVENQGIHIHIIAACIYVIKQRLITERKLYSIHGRDFTNMFSFETRFEALCLVYICKGCWLKYCCEQYQISCSNLTALTFQWNGYNLCNRMVNWHRWIILHRDRTTVTFTLI